ncbi:Jupiter microtubule associated 2 [Merluccius polli]|uniref:Jupiter microtubule associated 2 n=1 Tax=Merluccius polli TaxID=89951 RepID=A0AA47M2Q8_MERPO|nr:Jupiter microtubule associated 2 [Merluccius polli]
MFCRVLRPPGGGSSNLFGNFEEDASPRRRPNKMASAIFDTADEPREAAARRSNPPGGKTSGIFGGAEAPAQQPRQMPPGGPTSNIFGGAEPGQTQSRSHPNKPKDNFSARPEPEAPVAPQPMVSQAEVKEQPVSPPPASPVKVEAAVPPATPEPAPESATSFPDDDFGKNHEPHLGPKPRSHNRVLNPPGGKSSVVFY